jgi:hypothetical protein
MTQKFISIRWVKQPSILFVAFFLYSSVALAQANYWTIFGDVGTGCSPSAHVDNNKMSCSTVPSSFTGIPNQDDRHYFVSGYQNYLQNSAYNYAGTLLFTVNIDGIYAPNGDQVFAFESNTDYPDSYGIDRYVQLTNASSEISIVPVPGATNSYYVLCWCTLYNDGTAEDNFNVLRAVRVDITSNFGTSSLTSTWFNLTDNIIGQQPDDASYTYFYKKIYTGSFEIAADAANCDNSRDIYTAAVEEEMTSSGHTANYTVIRKWHISPAGILPTSSTQLTTTELGYFPSTTKAKIFSLPATGGGIYKVLSFTVNPSSAGNANTLMTFNLNTHDISYYVAPTSSDPFQNIWGFEYIRSRNNFVFAYEDARTPTSGGLGYASPVTSGWVNFTAISSTQHYFLSDLELNKHGDLCMVYDDFATPGNGSLAYISASSLAGSGSISSVLSSATRPTTCSTPSYVSSGNIQAWGNPFSPRLGWYLGSQIRGEDYNTWGSNPATYHVTGTDTWTPTDNPITRLTGATSANPINMKDIEIHPGAILNINGLTIQFSAGSHISVDEGTTTIGGRLNVNNSVLTRGGCDGSSSWGGVLVRGYAGNSQYPLSSSSQAAAIITGSTISYAQIGVAAGNLTSITAGGGIVIAKNCSFLNNAIGAYFATYRNSYPWSPATEISNQSYFRQCSFTSTTSTVASGTLIDIYAVNVKDINTQGCDFNNNSGITNSYAIKGYNAGLAVNGYPASSPSTHPCTFNNYKYGIYQTSFDAAHTVIAQNSIFDNDGVGVALLNTIAPKIVGNNFKVHQDYSTYTYPWIVPAGTYISSIGLLLQGADLYSVYSNSFQSIASHSLPPWATSNNTVGVLAYKTGGADNLINNNSYTGFGVANLAEYKNRYGNSGLWYKCNTQSGNSFDIVARGNNNNITSGDGIRTPQGISQYTTWHSHTYTVWVPSGNTFSYSPGGGFTTWVAYNLYSPSSETYSFDYYYYQLTANPLEIPGVVGTTGLAYDATATFKTDPDQCLLPSVITGTDAGTAFGVGTTMQVGPIPGSDDGLADYLATTSNINYYMNDSNGTPHRDSLYYWMKQINSLSGDLASANLFLEDGNQNQAYSIFDSIQYKRNLDIVEKTELNTWGRRVFNIQANILSYKAYQKALIASAHSSSHADSILADSMFNAIVNAPYSLSAGALDTLVHVFDSSHYWARLRAEAILSQYAPDTFATMIAAMPDTFLYPTLPDSLMQTKSPAGVLAVTEVSQGPAVGSGAQGCAYAEMLVSNCSTNSSLLVDVSGWIIDDNSGNFNTLSCSGDSSGITRGHYRLNLGSAIWQNIKVGSTIVVYNAGNNCYNLPDTFTVDSANAIYWVPVFDTALADTGYVLQRYDGGENTDAGTYCSDTGASVYTNAYGWEQTIKFNSPADAFQVRCPGCTVARPGIPAFYHGIGYAPDSTYCFSPVSAGTYGLGGPILYNYSSANMKYSFIGGTAADFSDPSKWQVLDADTAGTPPLSLGYVDSTLSANVLSYALGLPCCGSGIEGRSTHHSAQPPAGGEVSAIQVYPNPANMMLYFRFPAGRVTIKLTDVTGRVMDQQIISGKTQAAFNVKAYTPGIYLYQVITNGKTQSGKVLIEK